MPTLKVWNGATWDVIGGVPGASGPAGGAGPAGGTFNLVIAGNTSGATASISSGTLTLAGGAGITLSQAGNAITIMQPEVTRSLLYEAPAQTALTASNAGLMLQPLQIRGPITASEFNWMMSGSFTTSTGSGTVSAWCGVYDVVNGTSLALLSSGSVSYSMAASASTLWHSLRQWSMPFNMNASRGDYAMGLIVRTSGQGVFSIFGANTQNFFGSAGIASNVTNKILPFLGLYTSSTTGLPANIPSASIMGSGSYARRYDFMFRLLGA
jgi:hypothetical protein